MLNNMQHFTEVIYQFEEQTLKAQKHSLDFDLLEEQLPSSTETVTITHTSSRQTDASEPLLLSKPHGGDIITMIYFYDYHFQSSFVTLGNCAVCVCADGSHSQLSILVFESARTGTRRPRYGQAVKPTNSPPENSVFFWKHWMGKTVRTLPHLPQFLCCTLDIQMPTCASCSWCIYCKQLPCFNGTVFVFMPLIFASILQLSGCGSETPDHNSFWHVCSSLNNISAIQSKGMHTLKWKMFHNVS